jgi:hypothetical protein
MTEHAMPGEELQDLLLERATAGLDPMASAELERLMLERPEASAAEAEAIERSVAATMLAMHVHPDPLPEHLVERILRRALVPTAAPVTALPDRRIRPRRGAPLAWWSAAACLAIAFAGWWPRLFVSPPAAAPQARAALLASGRAVRAEWMAGAAAPSAGISGDVVFDPVTQRGYLRLRGVPANDPRLQQYQLWIADAGRAQPEPVDGGVFDVDAAALAGADGEVLIPFQPRLPVRAPAAFVVTLEQPGGVVVSRQQHVLALAKVQTG